MNPAGDINQQLRELAIATCQHPPGSLSYQQHLTRLIRAIVDSGKLWQEQTADYEEALQQTWLYLCRNLCRACTGKPYDPNISAVTTWLNAYLKHRLQDLRLQKQARQAQQQENAAALETLAAPPDVPPLLDDIRQWVETDPSGELRQLHIRGRPDLTAQVLIRHRLPPETGWKELEAKWGCPLSTLANFYQRHCLPRLRKFGESEGYL